MIFYAQNATFKKKNIRSLRWRFIVSISF